MAAPTYGVGEHVFALLLTISQRKFNMRLIRPGGC
jgi:hypothetical protein